MREAQVPYHARALTSSAWGTISKPPIGEPPPESPVSRLRACSTYRHETDGVGLHALLLTLSVADKGYQPEWR